MGRAIQIARIFGIPIKLHWTYILVLPAVYMIWTQDGLGTDAIIFFSILFILLTVCVILHELGHAVMAKRFGIKTDDIILSPLFGVARIRQMPEAPTREFWVAAAGPLVNLVICIFLAGYLLVFAPTTVEQISTGLTDALQGKANLPGLENAARFELGMAILFIINLVLVVFNLVPALPMDGGRMFRAGLSIFTDKLTATRIATFVAQMFVILLFGVAYFTGQWVLAILAAFIFIMSGQELRVTREETFRKQFTLAEVVKTNYTPLNSFSTRTEVKELMDRGFERNFAVFDNEGKLSGILTENELARWFNTPNSGVGNDIEIFVRRDFIYLTPDISLDKVITNMRNSELGMLPVLMEDKSIGLIDSDSVFEFLKFRKKLRS